MSNQSVAFVAIINVVWIAVLGLTMLNKEKREQTEKFVAFRDAIQICSTKDFPEDPAICFDTERLMENRLSTCAAQKEAACMNRMQLILDSMLVAVE
jgi:hypothetical protein